MKDGTCEAHAEKLDSIENTEGAVNEPRIEEGEPEAVPEHFNNAPLCVEPRPGDETQDAGSAEGEQEAVLGHFDNPSLHILVFLSGQNKCRLATLLFRMGFYSLIAGVRIRLITVVIFDVWSSEDPNSVWSSEDHVTWNTDIPNFDTERARPGIRFLAWQLTMIPAATDLVRSIWWTKFLWSVPMDNNIWWARFSSEGKAMAVFWCSVMCVLDAGACIGFGLLTWIIVNKSNTSLDIIKDCAGAAIIVTFDENLADALKLHIPCQRLSRLKQIVNAEYDTYRKALAHANVWARRATWILAVSVYLCGAVLFKTL